MRGKIIAGTVVALGLLSSPAFAVVTPLGALDPDTFDSASLTGKLPAAGDTFTEEYTFTLTTTGLVSPGVIITSAAGPGRLPKDTDVELCQGGPTTDCTASEPLVIKGSTASVTLDTLKLDGGAGSPTYYLVFTGTSNGKLSVGGTVSTAPAVPEPATWAMMLLGFTGLGYAAFRRSAKGHGVLAI
jgi:PEP-CTERM motif-containing protein